MPFLLAEILSFQGSNLFLGVGSFSKLYNYGSFYASSRALFCKFTVTSHEKTVKAIAV